MDFHDPRNPGPQSVYHLPQMGSIITAEVSRSFRNVVETRIVLQKRLTSQGTKGDEDTGKDKKWKDTSDINFGILTF